MELSAYIFHCQVSIALALVEHLFPHFGILQKMKQKKAAYQHCQGGCGSQGSESSGVS
uniref:Uncharacterized protein n=1 Tax=Rhizophora mucronata TaxID=61149 RepID=A0A2P2NLZ8_RHIMU